MSGDTHETRQSPTAAQRSTAGTATVARLRLVARPRTATVSVDDARLVAVLRRTTTLPVPCTVLDPFAGSGTTCLVARHHGRHSIGIELNETTCEIAADRLSQLSLLSEGAL